MLRAVRSQKHRVAEAPDRGVAGRHKEARHADATVTPAIVVNVHHVGRADLGSESCVVCGRHAAVVLSPARTYVTLPSGEAEIRTPSFALCRGDDLIAQATGLLPRYCPGCDAWRHSGLTCSVCGGLLGWVD